MELTPDLLATAAVGLLVILGAIGNYLRTLKKPTVDPLLAGVAGGFVDRDQMERLILQVQRIADAITDKNTSSINHRLEELAEAIEHLKDAPRKR